MKCTLKAFFWNGKKAVPVTWDFDASTLSEAEKKADSLIRASDSKDFQYSGVQVLKVPKVR